MPTSSWNLNRFLVAMGALATLTATFVVMNYSFSAWISEIGMFAPGIPGWIATIALLFFAPAWMYLLSGILVASFPILVLFVFGLIATISDPLRGGEYGAAIFLVLGLVLSLTGGIAGFVQGRKAKHTPLAGGLRSAKGVLAAVVAAVLIGAFVTSSMATAAMQEMSGSSYNVVPDETIALTTQDYAFAPQTVNVPVGKLVEITITNADPAAHTFTYHAGGKSYETFLAPGSTAKMLVRFDEPQTIHFYCEPHSGGADDMADDSMWGTITVA